MKKVEVTVREFVEAFYSNKLSNIELDKFTGFELVEMIEMYNKLLEFIASNYKPEKPFELKVWVEFIERYFEWKGNRDNYKSDFEWFMFEPNPPHYDFANND